MKIHVRTPVSLRICLQGARAGRWAWDRRELLGVTVALRVRATGCGPEMRQPEQEGTFPLSSGLRAHDVTGFQGAPKADTRSSCPRLLLRFWFFPNSVQPWSFPKRLSPCAAGRSVMPRPALPKSKILGDITGTSGCKRGGGRGAAIE